MSQFNLHSMVGIGDFLKDNDIASMKSTCKGMKSLFRVYDKKRSLLRKAQQDLQWGKIFENPDLILKTDEHPKGRPILNTFEDRERYLQSISLETIDFNSTEMKLYRSAIESIENFPAPLSEDSRNNLYKSYRLHQYLTETPHWYINIKNTLSSISLTQPNRYIDNDGALKVGETPQDFINYQLKFSNIDRTQDRDIKEFKIPSLSTLAAIESNYNTFLSSWTIDDQRRVCHQGQISPAVLLLRRASKSCDSEDTIYHSQSGQKNIYNRRERSRTLTLFMLMLREEGIESLIPFLGDHLERENIISNIDLIAALFATIDYDFLKRYPTMSECFLFYLIQHVKTARSFKSTFDIILPKLGKLDNLNIACERSEEGDYHLIPLLLCDRRSRLINLGSNDCWNRSVIVIYTVNVIRKNRNIKMTDLVAYAEQYKLRNRNDIFQKVDWIRRYRKRSTYLNYSYEYYCKIALDHKKNLENLLRDHTLRVNKTDASTKLWFQIYPSRLKYATDEYKYYLNLLVDATTSTESLDQIVSNEIESYQLNLTSKAIS